MVSAMPLALAYLLYFTSAGSSWLKSATHGILLEKPLQVSVAGSTDAQGMQKWQLWYIVADTCDKRCQTDLALLQNAHIALGKDRDRVVLKTVSPQEALPFLKPGTVAVLDPYHWLMIYYLPEMPYQGLLTDLRKMLKYSHIG